MTDSVSQNVIVLPSNAFVPGVNAPALSTDSSVQPAWGITERVGGLPAKAETEQTKNVPRHGTVHCRQCRFQRAPTPFFTPPNMNIFLVFPG